MEHQSIGPMLENVSGRRWRVGSTGTTGWENSVHGMKKGGRRFIVFHGDNAAIAYDIQVGGWGVGRNAALSFNL